MSIHFLPKLLSNTWSHLLFYSYHDYHFFFYSLLYRKRTQGGTHRNHSQM